MKYVWVFNQTASQFSGGVFSNRTDAENWILKNNLTGLLTKYPLDVGVFDWALDNDLLNIKPHKVEEKSSNPKFIGGFTTASQDHFHYENGKPI